MEKNDHPSRRTILASAAAWGIASLHGVASGASASPFGHDALVTSPNCTLTLDNGRRSINLSQLRGKVVYVDFWASWCTPCLLSFPFMNKLQEEFSGQGLEIVAINMDEKSDDARAFLSKHKPSFDTTIGANPPCAKAFGVADMPSTYLIDRKGSIRMSHSGFRDGDVEFLRSRVAALLVERE